MKKLRVLVVDNDRQFVGSVAEILELHGHQIQLAFGGEEAIERSAKEDFDVTFMDVKMPGKNGFESITEIRQARPQVKGIMMNRYRAEPLLARAVENGARAGGPRAPARARCASFNPHGPPCPCDCVLPGFCSCGGQAEPQTCRSRKSGVGSEGSREGAVSEDPFGRR